MKLSKELQDRGFVHQTSGDLVEIVDGKKRTVYLGVDPTADSIHAGNFVIYMLLRHLAEAGHKIILVAGGGTGRIGDPKPDAERVLIADDEVNHRIEKLKKQATKLLDIENLQIVDNFEWLGKLNLIEFLRDIGKNFTVNELIKKDAIAERLKSEAGLSYTEFAYPLLQGYDYLELHQKYGCDVQVGGSDQWGNIVAGVDLIRRKEQQTVYALTVPLVIDKATGKKFGKSEGNAVWLDAEKTSPYNFYQFWLNTSDENVIDYLKLFTLLPLEDISVIERDNLANPSARAAQRILAREVTTLVHGEDVADQVEQVTQVLFGEATLDSLNKDEKTTLLENAPTQKVAQNKRLIDVLVDSGLATSKREARMFIESEAISVDDQKITSIDAELSGEMLNDGLALLRRGKKQVVVLVSE